MGLLSGATAFSISALCFCRSIGPIASRGTFNCALLKKATSRKINAGERERRVGNDDLSLAIDDVEEPRLTISFTTCSADAEPFDVNKPGHALKT